MSEEYLKRPPLIVGALVALIYAGAYFWLFQSHLGVLAAEQDAAVSLVERGFSAFNMISNGY